MDPKCPNAGTSWVILDDRRILHRCGSRMTAHSILAALNPAVAHYFIRADLHEHDPCYPKPEPLTYMLDWFRDGKTIEGVYQGKQFVICHCFSSAIATLDEQVAALGVMREDVDDIWERLALFLKLGW